jgi:hypothetical protein
VPAGAALHVRYLIQGTRGDQQASLETIDRALAVIGEEPETTDLRLLLLGNRSVPLDELARVSEAGRSIGEALTLAERSGSPQRLANLRIQAADNYFRRGRWDDALAEIEHPDQARRPVPGRDRPRRVRPHACRIAGYASPWRG